jgi:hypothetical protein
MPNLPDEDTDEGKEVPTEIHRTTPLMTKMHELFRIIQQAYERSDWNEVMRNAELGLRSITSTKEKMDPAYEQTLREYMREAASWKYTRLCFNAKQCWSEQRWDEAESYATDALHVRNTHMTDRRENTEKDAATLLCIIEKVQNARRTLKLLTSGAVPPPSTEPQQ